MAFQFAPGESVNDGTRRLALEQIGAAITHLRCAKGDRQEHIHASRKCMKRLRGLVRLVRGELGDEVYRRENACFREIAQGLSGLRDAEALIEALDDLVIWLGPRSPKSRFAAIRRWLNKRRVTAYQKLEADETRVEEAVALLDEAEKRVSSWPLHGDGFTVMADGMRRVYGRGRKEFAEALWRPATSAMHGWRKRVKYLWYHVQLLRDTWPQMMQVTQAELDQLGDMLGKDHDLALLFEVVVEEFPRSGASATVGALKKRIGERRAALQDECFVSGRQLYAERPGAFVRRMQAYWMTWGEGHIYEVSGTGGVLQKSKDGRAPVAGPADAAAGNGSSIASPLR
jgi:CHAD domain-containing protein